MIESRDVELQLFQINTEYEIQSMSTEQIYLYHKFTNFLMNFEEKVIYSSGLSNIIIIIEVGFLLVICDLWSVIYD